MNTHYTHILWLSFLAVHTCAHECKTRAYTFFCSLVFIHAHECTTRKASLVLALSLNQRNHHLPEPEPACSARPSHHKAESLLAAGFKACACICRCCISASHHLYKVPYGLACRDHVHPGFTSSFVSSPKSLTHTHSFSCMCA
jgi:hypothetical protein